MDEIAEVLSRQELSGTRWSVVVRPVRGGRAIFSTAPDTLLRTASVAKVFLLVEVAAAIEESRLHPDLLVARSSTDRVEDSGLWQHLAVDELPLGDVAQLVGSVSDNWATNALLALVGLDAVQARARALAPGGSMLLDRVRDTRTADHPEVLSTGSAADWAAVFGALGRREVVSPSVGRTVLRWLGAGTDLSMVASAFGLDPLSHALPDRGVSLWNKTGTDEGVRADVGLVVRGERELAYAAICNWDPADAGPVGGPAVDRRDAVLAAMRTLGEGVRQWCYRPHR